MSNPNAIKRNSRLLRMYIKSQDMIEKEMEKIEDEIKTLEPTVNEEQRISIVRLYQRLGEMIKRHRNIRIMVHYYQEKLWKKVNITG